MKKLVFIFGTAFAVVGAIVTLSVLVGAVSAPGSVGHDAADWNLFGLWLILNAPADAVAHLLGIVNANSRQWIFLAVVTNAVLCSLLGVSIGILTKLIFRLPTKRTGNAV